MRLALPITALFLCLALTLGQGWQLGLSARRFVGQREAADTVARLAQSTLHAFKGQRPPAGEAFWAALGRPALRDPWGQAYDLEVPSPSFFLWRSPGPDGLARTADDIVRDMPYGEDYYLSVTQPPISSEPVTTRDAK